MVNIITRLLELNCIPLSSGIHLFAIWSTHLLFPVLLFSVYKIIIFSYTNKSSFLFYCLTMLSFNLNSHISEWINTSKVWHYNKVALYLWIAFNVHPLANSHCYKVWVAAAFVARHYSSVCACGRKELQCDKEKNLFHTSCSTSYYYLQRKQLQWIEYFSMLFKADESILNTVVLLISIVVD